jgi:metal-responsive CopG/Arc/MetJ family transcriptional regulator
LDKSEKENKHMEKTIEMVRERVSITLPKELLEWIDKKIEARTYANRSHAIEVLILEAMKREKKE